MVHQIRRGRRGWLESNYRDLERFREEHPDKIQLKPETDLETFQVRIAGTGRYHGHYLKIRCHHPHPGQPPSFEILDAAEVGRLDHPHIKDVHVCLRAPWRPNTPLSVPLRAICEAWWRPTR